MSKMNHFVDELLEEGHLMKPVMVNFVDFFFE